MNDKNHIEDEGWVSMLIAWILACLGMLLLILCVCGMINGFKMFVGFLIAQ